MKALEVIVLGFLTQFLVELFMQVAFEAAAAFVIHLVKVTFLRVGAQWLGTDTEHLELRLSKSYPMIYTMLYSVLGIAFGLISLAIFPSHLIKTILHRQMGLALIPIISGLVLGVGRDREGTFPLRFRWIGFAYGFAFGLAYCLTRYLRAI